MSRFAKLPEAVPAGVNLYTTNTASATTAYQSIIRTASTTSNFLSDGGAHLGVLKFKLVDSKGVAQQGLVRVSARSSVAANISVGGFTAVDGTLFSVNNAALQQAYDVDVLSDATGLVTLNIQMAAAATLQVAVSYGDYQLIVSLAVA